MRTVKELANVFKEELDKQTFASREKLKEIRNEKEQKGLVIRACIQGFDNRILNFGKSNLSFKRSLREIT